MNGLVDAKQKREVFSRRYTEELRRLVGSDIMLLQGSLYPDMIESGYSMQWSDALGEELVRSHADVIKLHHNSQMLEEFRRRKMLCEPLRYLFKDEVRAVSRKAGLPREISEREPFPGTGGFVRHAGNVKVLDEFDEVEAYVNEVAQKHGMDGYLFPILTVGVQGDKRTYSNMAILTGSSDWAQMRAACKEIVTNTHDVNRVAYCLSHDSLDRSELRNTQSMPISRETMELWREIDHAGMSVFRADPSYERVSQMPISLLAGRWAYVRDFSTQDFMTGRPLEKPEEMSWDVVRRASDAMMNAADVKRLGGIRGVFLDITDKPPATTEAE
jgi:GMP synthase (glutamine-hydrolysing)